MAVAGVAGVFGGDPIAYELKLPDGTTVTSGYYSWLTNVDLVTPALTISTTDEADTGIYDFELFG